MEGFSDQCNLCGSSRARLIKEDSYEGYFPRRIVECVECGLAYVNPQPSMQQLENFYSGKHYVEIPEVPDENVAEYEGDQRIVYRSKRRVQKIKKYRRSGNLLDCGVNDGTFIKHAKEAGYQAYGLEISPAMAVFAQKYAGTVVEEGTLDDFAEKYQDLRLDLITMWDVLEHVLDPMAELKKMNKLLNPGGVIALSTPNRGSLRGRMYGDGWLGFQEGAEHLFFFSPEVMCRYLRLAGFRVLKVYGWMTAPVLLRFVDWFKLGNILEVYAQKT